MKDTICRKCFARHPLGEIAYGCQNEDCGQKGSPVVFQGEEPRICSECGEDLSVQPRLCPSCGFPMPSAKEAGRKHLGVSIIGAEGSGKSHYLSVVVDQIKSTMAKPYQCSLYPLGGDRTIDHYDSYYYKPLYVKGECISSTAQDEVDPLVYSLVFTGERKKMGKNCSLTFYDACGANFHRERTMALYNRSLCNAQGILFLIDPSQLPGLREEYKTHGLPVCEEDVMTLLSRAVHLIKTDRKNRKLGGKIDIPFAVCLTKTDVLSQRMDPSSFLRCPSRHMREPMFDLLDYNCCNLEMQSLLENWAGRELLNQIRSQFSRFGFFGFSALGTSPLGDARVPRISPHRVLDPLLWIMWQNRVITAGNAQ